MKKYTLAILSVLLLCFENNIHAQIRLPRLIRDSMILQRDIPVKIWGWAAKNEQVKISFNNKTYKTTADAAGKWKVMLAATKAGGPYTMTISGSNKIVLKDILLGDVWICAGQSNMVHQMALHSVRYADEIAGANEPEIRQFWVPNVTNLQSPQEDLPAGSWKWANPTDVKDFSAVAYFFAKKLYEKYHVPIGIINESWGGVPIEAWMSEESLKDFPAILNTVQKNKDTAYIAGLNKKNLDNIKKIAPPEDKGMTEKWYDAAYVPKQWHRIAVPGFWQDQGAKVNGVVWYRKEINVPASMLQVPAKVFLGRIVDADVLYINGQQIGNTTYLYPQRRYAVPTGVLKEGKNIFTVRITNNLGKGGFVPDKPYQLISGKDTIDLAGYWEYKVGLVYRPQQGFGGGGIVAQNQPTALYNAMLAPVIDYSIKGFVWYQGESNAGKAAEYARLQPALIVDWRNKWNEGALPFLFTQLPGFGDYNYLPSESQWADFREAQAKSLSVQNTAMVVTIDVGEWNDIHPDRKKEVGDRLALAAEKIAYNENISYLCPMFQSASIEENTIIISFTNAANGLTTNDGEEPQEFAIAGADKKFVWAKAQIQGNKIIVSSNEISEPKYVRYAWADMPVNPNLINKEGLPVAPFRTDK
ncbi:MAG: sialate O-acetylesterase [Chitinophagaceae bacterium]|nr:sialate O-acetylesterase [Chitinophagaceae bacterium]